MINVYNSGHRKNIFICSAISGDKKLISEDIVAYSKEEAIKIFLDKNLIDAEIIYGPFRNKKIKLVEPPKDPKVLKFTKNKTKAIYNGWLVNAFMLEIPADHSYLVFIKRIDDDKMNAPKGTIIVPTSNLRIYYE
jgi:hypothetical protein